MEKTRSTDTLKGVYIKDKFRLILKKEGISYISVRESKETVKILQKFLGEKFKIFDDPFDEVNFIINEKIKSYIKGHGGDIIVKEVDENKGEVYVELKDACSGCPHSVYTLVMGIEKILKEFLPWVKKVKPVGEPREPEFNFKLVDFLKRR